MFLCCLHASVPNNISSRLGENRLILKFKRKFEKKYNLVYISDIYDIFWIDNLMIMILKRNIQTLNKNKILFNLQSLHVERFLPSVILLVI
jgi:hypothetical protein